MLAGFLFFFCMAGLTVFFVGLLVYVFIGRGPASPQGQDDRLRRRSIGPVRQGLAQYVHHLLTEASDDEVEAIVLSNRFPPGIEEDIRSLELKDTTLFTMDHDRVIIAAMRRYLELRGTLDAASKQYARGDNHLLVCEAAIALARLNDPVGFPALINNLKEPHNVGAMFQREAVAVALGYLYRSGLLSDEQKRVVEFFRDDVVVTKSATGAVRLPRLPGVPIEPEPGQVVRTLADYLEPRVA